MVQEDLGDNSPDLVTAWEYVSQQSSLEREARQLMPYDPNKCTYSLGALRQQVYACLTCSENTKQMCGVCYSCSIQCHSDHNIVELFTKRNFICDCGTTRVQHPCELRSKVEDDLPSSTNEYNHNFRGKFCHCERDYNPVEETGNMLQCILGDVCQEDWFHDYCIMGLPKFKPEKKENEGVNLLDTLKEPELGEVGGDSQKKNNRQQDTNPVELNDTNNNNNNNDDDDDDDEPAIDGFPRLDDFDCFICWKCVNTNKDFFDLIKDNETFVEDCLLRIESESIQERNEKLKAQSSFLNNLKRRKIEYDYSLFLKHGHEQNFTRLLSEYPQNSPQYQNITAFFIKFPFLLKDYQIYEPPQDEDDDDNSSIYELGSKVINSLPREKAIQGIEAYQQIKDKLKTFLTPFAQDGKVVNKEDIETFFSALKKDKT